MATVKIELANLKLRATKGQRAEKITVVDQTKDEKWTSTVAEAIPILANRVEKGQGEHVLHIVFHSEEKARKLTNPNKSTKAIVNCHTPELWRAFQTAKERYYDIAVDPSLALSLVVKALKEPSDETVRAWLNDGHTQPGDVKPGPAPPKAEIPGLDWLK